jgi:hypothetical protein
VHHADRPDVHRGVRRRIGFATNATTAHGGGYAVVPEGVTGTLSAATASMHASIAERSGVKSRAKAGTAASGLNFEEASSRAITVEIEGLVVRIPAIADLIRNKRASTAPCSILPALKR